MSAVRRQLSRIAAQKQPGLVPRDPAPHTGKMESDVAGRGVVGAGVAAAIGVVLAFVLVAAAKDAKRCRDADGAVPSLARV